MTKTHEPMKTRKILMEKPAFRIKFASVVASLYDIGA